MRRQLKQLKQFQETFDATVNDEPTVIDRDTAAARYDFMAEELDEFMEAIEGENIVEVADAIVDILYLAYGTAIACGLQNHLEDCFDEVHFSNMSKVGPNGEIERREDGKILKPETFEEPDLENIVLEEPERISETHHAHDSWPQGEIDNTRELLTRMFVEKHKLRNDEVTYNEKKDGHDIVMTVKADLI